MNSTRRLVLGAVAAGWMAALGVRAEDTVDEARPKYFPIPEQPTDDPSRIEVREFFYYGCGACYAFEPYLREWAAGIPADVQLVRMPALRTTRWIPLTMVYWVLFKLGAQARLHQEVFDAYHFDSADLGDRSTFVEWAASKGLDPDLVRATWDSPELAKAVELTHLTTRRYGVQGVPTLIVDGRYLTSPSLAAGQQESLTLVNQLIARRREERAKSGT